MSIKTTIIRDGMMTIIHEGKIVERKKVEREEDKDRDTVRSFGQYLERQRRYLRDGFRNNVWDPINCWTSEIRRPWRDYKFSKWRFERVVSADDEFGFAIYSASAELSDEAKKTKSKESITFIPCVSGNIPPTLLFLAAICLRYNDKCWYTAGGAARCLHAVPFENMCVHIVDEKRADKGKIAEWCKSFLGRNLQKAPPVASVEPADYAIMKMVEAIYKECATPTERDVSLTSLARLKAT